MINIPDDRHVNSDIHMGINIYTRSKEEEKKNILPIPNSVEEYCPLDVQSSNLPQRPRLRRRPLMHTGLAPAALPLSLCLFLERHTGSRSHSWCRSLCLLLPNVVSCLLTTTGTNNLRSTSTEREPHSTGIFYRGLNNKCLQNLSNHENSA